MANSTGDLVLAADINNLASKLQNIRTKFGLSPTFSYNAGVIGNIVLDTDINTLINQASSIRTSFLSNPAAHLSGISIPGTVNKNDLIGNKNAELDGTLNQIIATCYPHRIGHQSGHQSGHLSGAGGSPSYYSDYGGGAGGGGDGGYYSHDSSDKPCGAGHNGGNYNPNNYGHQGGHQSSDNKSHNGGVMHGPCASGDCQWGACGLWI